MIAGQRPVEIDSPTDEVNSDVADARETQFAKGLTMARDLLWDAGRVEDSIDRAEAPGPEVQPGLDETIFRTEITALCRSRKVVSPGFQQWKCRVLGVQEAGFYGWSNAVRRLALVEAEIKRISWAVRNAPAAI